MGLIQAFAFNTIYFESDNFNLHTHAIRRHYASSIVWVTIHLPFVMSFVLSGAALSRLVLAHDCSNTPVDTLVDAYAAKSEDEISTGVRWFYCAGLGISFGCMAIISLCHVYKLVPGAKFKHSKIMRICFRLTISVVIIFLGFAKLNSFQLIGTTTALVGGVLGVEMLFDMACEHEQQCKMSKKKVSFFKRFCGGEEKQCKYMARCNVSKKDLEASVRDGSLLKVHELKGEKGIFCPG